MVQESKTARVLLVGDASSVARAGLTPGDGCVFDRVGSLAEVVERLSLGEYERVIVDPSVLDLPRFEFLPYPAPCSALDSDSSQLSSSLSSDHFTGVSDIIESIRDSFFCLDRNWCFTLVNGEAERQFGRSRGEIIGRSIWEVFPRIIGTEYEVNYRRSMETI